MQEDRLSDGSAAPELVNITATIVAAYVSNNTVAAGANRIHGSVQFTYNGTLGAVSSTTTTTTTGPTTYVNNVSGWMEQ